MIQTEKWQKDLSVYQDINTTFIIEGNVHDLQPWTYDEGVCEPVPLAKYLHRYLSGVGYDPVVFYDRIDGFHNPYAMEMIQTFHREVDSDGRNDKSISEATELIRKALSNKNRPTAIVFDLANTITSSPDSLSEEAPFPHSREGQRHTGLVLPEQSVYPDSHDHKTGKGSKGGCHKRETRFYGRRGKSVTGRTKENNGRVHGAY